MGVMGSGIALQVKTDFPEAYNGYRDRFKECIEKGEPHLPLGTSIWVKCNDGRTIINAITQKEFGRDKDRVYVDYDAVRAVMKQINAAAIAAKAAFTDSPIEAVAFPTIGAGLANGSWKIIARIIEEESKDFQPVVYLFDGNMPTS